MRLTGLLVLGGVLLGGCEPARQSAAPLTIACTIAPLGYLVRDLVGDQARVEVLLPPGNSAHTFELTLRGALALARARLVVRVGPGLDDWLAGLVEPAVPVFVAMDHAPLLAQDHDHHGDHGAAPAADHGDEPPAGDPHIWLDPLLMRNDVLPALVAQLRAVGVELSAARVARVEQDLMRLHHDLDLATLPLRGQRYVASHPSMGYFDRRYGCQTVATLERAGGLEPSLRWLAEAVRTTRQTSAAAVFSEAQGSAALARIVGEETGLPVGELDPLGNASAHGAADYASFLRRNATELAQVMGRARP